MPGQLPKDVAKMSVDRVLLIPPGGASTGHVQKPSSALWTMPPPGWTWEQYHLFLVHYHWAYHHSNNGGQHPLHTYPTRGISQNWSKLCSNAPVSNDSIEKSSAYSTRPLTIQVLEDSATSEPTVVTPLEHSPSPPASESSSKSAADLSNDKSLAIMLMNLPDDARKSTFFVAIHVERPSLINPWGLEFVNTESNRFLVINAKWKPHVKENWCRVLMVPAKDNPSSSFAKNIYSTRPRKLCKNDTVYASALLASISMASTHVKTALPTNQHLICPGDLIVAIDGHSLSSFGALSAVVDHLKSVTSTCIVLARSYKVTTAAASAMLVMNDERLELVCKANQTWNEILHSASTPNDYGAPIHRKLFSKTLPSPSEILRNPLFQEDGQDMPYEDNDTFYVPNDGTAAALFMKPIGNFPHWLSRRKSAWRRQYTVYEHSHEILKKRRVSSCAEKEVEERSCSVTKDFWTQQGFISFDDWMTSRVMQWKMSYSWNQRKRKRIQQDCFEVVHISAERVQFKHWLSVRRRQWRLQRRKRQRVNVRRQADEETASNHVQAQDSHGLSTLSSVKEIASAPAHSCASKLFCSDDKEMAIMDEIIEAEEARRHESAKMRRVPIDITKFFDAANGIPDDIIVNCFEYLERKEHLRVLGIDKATSKSLQARNDVWKSLCPSHWILPRRPRKPWYELYCGRMKTEYEQHQKTWDDLLVKCANILDSSDSLCKIEKLIEKAEKCFGFDVNYISGVVCERNSLLNLAVIHKRHKVTKWLVDVKKADIETFDRGNFTPLLNAAWEGDRTLVRFFLQKGADRSVRGTQHYSKAIAPPGFEGMTADEWADKRGYPDVARLIRVGL
jgi:hypothetical protein